MWTLIGVLLILIGVRLCSWAIRSLLSVGRIAREIERELQRLEQRREH